MLKSVLHFLSRPTVITVKLVHQEPKREKYHQKTLATSVHGTTVRYLTLHERQMMVYK